MYTSSFMLCIFFDSKINPCNYEIIRDFWIFILHFFPKGDEAEIPKNGVRPTFTERPVIRQTEDEAKVLFECRLVGEPLPEVVWYHNDTRLKGSRRHKMTLTEADSKLFYFCHLEISNVEAADAGVYKAVAKNKIGEGTATINLAFEEGKESQIWNGLLHFKWDILSGAELSSKPKIPDGIPPRFPKKPSIRQEGDNLVMECLLEAHPFPEITWYKGDKVTFKHHINNSSHIECLNMVYILVDIWE